MSHNENLNEKIKFEFDQIDKELEILVQLRDKNKKQELDNIEIRAAASTLHSIYNGIEKIIIFLCENQNITLIEHSNWHSQLLKISEENGIISKRIEERLRDLMGFRHFYRHAYGFMLEINLIEPLLNDVPDVIKEIKEEIKEDE